MGNPWRSARCRGCERPVSQVGELSQRGLCLACGVGVAKEQTRQMAAKSGPYYEDWLERQRRYLERLLDRV